MNALQPENKHPLLASYLPKVVTKAPPAEHQVGHRAHMVTVSGHPVSDEIINGRVPEVPKIGVTFELRSTPTELGWIYEGPLLTMECHGVPADKFTEALRQTCGATTLEIVSQTNDVAQVVAFFARA